MHEYETVMLIGGPFHGRFYKLRGQPVDLELCVVTDDAPCRLSGLPAGHQAVTYTRLEWLPIFAVAGEDIADLIEGLSCTKTTS